MTTGFEDVQKAGQENLTRAMESFGALSRGWQTLAEETADYSKKSFEASAAHMEKMLGTKSLEGAVEAQTDFMRASYEKAMGQAAKIGELYLGLMKDVSKPFEGMVPSAKK